MRLVWDQSNDRRYEAGVDRGVLYPSTGPGVVWNGLVSVEESFEGGEANAYYFDGVKYLDLVSPKNYQAVLTAFSAPAEFGPNVGQLSVVPGFILTRQPRSRFGFSYRTGLGERGYKLHLVYNATASPNGRGFSSLNETASADTMSWKIDAVPPRSSTHRPSAHFIFDSTKMDPDALDVLSSFLYGSDTLDPRMPTIDELLDLLTDWAPLIIIPESISGLSELVPGSGDLYKTKVAGIHRALPNTRLNKSPTNGLYRME